MPPSTRRRQCKPWSRWRPWRRSARGMLTPSLRIRCAEPLVFDWIVRAKDRHVVTLRELREHRVVRAHALVVEGDEALDAAQRPRHPRGVARVYEPAASGVTSRGGGRRPSPSSTRGPSPRGSPATHPRGRSRGGSATRCRTSSRRKPSASICGSAGMRVIAESIAIAAPKNAPSLRVSRTLSTPMPVSTRTSPCAAVSISKQCETTWRGRRRRFPR